MSKQNGDAAEVYKTMPQSFREFASTVFTVYRGYEQHKSRAYLAAKWHRDKHAEQSDRIGQIIEDFLDRAEEDYAKERIHFTVMLYYLSSEICLSKRLCLRVAEWLQKQKRVSKDDFRATMKALAYICGTNETGALNYLASATFERIDEVFAHTIDYLNDDILTPWVSDQIKEADRLAERAEDKK